MEEKKQHHTEEIQDIIDRMPHRYPLIISLIMIGLVLGMFILGWVIKYPESVSGMINLSARTAPIRLIAKSSGSIKMLNHADHDSLTSGEVFAVVTSAVNDQHALFLEKELQKDPYELLSSVSFFSHELELGSLTKSYYLFRLNLIKFKNHKKFNLYLTQRQLLKTQELGKKSTLASREKQYALSLQQSNLLKIELQRDSVEHYHLGSLSQSDYLKTKGAMLAELQRQQLIVGEINLLKSQAVEIRMELDKLKIDEEVFYQDLLLSVFESYNALKSELQQWKQAYAFEAPYEGVLEIVDFRRSGDFVQAGTEVFSIVPRKNTVTGEILLPSQGAGKVGVGQEVIIKLDNYPYLEFGAIKGKVRSVSMLASEIRIPTSQGNTSVAAYKVLVDLPEQLTTNYGRRLQFSHDITGRAEILTKKRRLLERLFDNLKYMKSI